MDLWDDLNVACSMDIRSPSWDRRRAVTTGGERTSHDLVPVPTFGDYDGIGRVGIDTSA